MVSYCFRWLSYRKSLKHATFLRVCVLIGLVGFAFTNFLQCDKQQILGLGRTSEFRNKAADLQLLFTSGKGFISLLFP